MQIKIFTRFSHTIWFPGTNVCRKQMSKQMPLFTWEEHFHAPNCGRETTAGDLRGQSEVIPLRFETANSQGKNIWGKIYQIRLNTKYIKQKPEKCWRRRKDRVSQKKHFILSPSWQKAFCLQFEGFGLRPLQLGSVLKAYMTLRTQSFRQISGTWTVTESQYRVLQSIKYKS